MANLKAVFEVLYFAAEKHVNKKRKRPKNKWILKSDGESVI